METVKGYVEHIVFRNEDNGYTVFNLNNDDGDLTCVGNFNYLSEGELVEVNGEYVVHSVYGTQLRVLNYEIKAPEDLLSIERYLGSGAIKGVGASLAGRIVKNSGKTPSGSSKKNQKDLRRCVGSANVWQERSLYR